MVWSGGSPQYRQPFGLGIDCKRAAALSEDTSDDSSSKIITSIKSFAMSNGTLSLLNDWVCFCAGCSGPNRAASLSEDTSLLSEESSDDSSLKLYSSIKIFVTFKTAFRSLTGHGDGVYTSQDILDFGSQYFKIRVLIL